MKDLGFRAIDYAIAPLKNMKRPHPFFSPSYALVIG